MIARALLSARDILEIFQDAQAGHEPHWDDEPSMRVFKRNNMPTLSKASGLTPAQRKAAQRERLQAMHGDGFRRAESARTSATVSAKRQERRRVLAATSPTCLFCGAPVEVKHGPGVVPKYCSKKCSTKAWYVATKARDKR